MKYIPKLSVLAVSLSLAISSGAAGASVELLSGLGGDRGYGELAMLPNDDESSNLLNLPFSINLYGQLFNQFYINNNGNISFNSPLWNYTPDPFPVSGQPMIAPYWADVDTRGGSTDGSNNVWLASPDSNTVVITWDKVGYYESKTDKLNSFQLVLRNRAETGSGNFDAEFRYNSLEWTTGDASEGTAGLGGIPAQAGFDAGDSVNFQALPGSFTAGVLDLQNTSNVSPDTPGLWNIAFRDGLLPGATAENPLLPVTEGNGWSFNFNVQLDQQVFVDPLVAIGYDYQVLSGPQFASVLLPHVGDDQFDIFLWDGSQWVFAQQAEAGELFTFGTPVDRFRVMGIEQSAGLDPNNPTAFVTGLTFDGAGAISMTQIAVAVPEPSEYALMLAGLGLIGWKARRRRS